MGPGHRSPTQHVKPPVSHLALRATIKRGARRLGGKQTLEIQVNLYDQYGYVPVARYSKQVEIDAPFPSRMTLMWEDYRADWLLTYLILPLAASTFGAWMTARMTVQLETKHAKLEKTVSNSRASAKTKASSPGAQTEQAERFDGIGARRSDRLIFGPLASPSGLPMLVPRR